MAMISSTDTARADTSNWIRVDEEGMLEQGSQSFVELQAFGSDLYAQAENGLFKFRSNPCLEWTKQTISLKDLSPFKSADLSQFPSGTTVKPILLFNGQLYAEVYAAGSTTFDIWRSPDFGKTSMIWNKVVSNGFGDPLNHKLGLLIEYNKKLVAVTTNTRTNPSASFGDEDFYGTGIEVWESPTGDDGSWYQINKDGFGTELTGFGGKTFRTNQDLGAGAIYKSYLYIGTKAHYGGQVWRYDGTGLNGWKDTTPNTMGVGKGPSRAMSMVVYQNFLYLGEGYPTGNLDKFDGSNWEIVIPSDPFAPTNVGIASLAIVDEKLYASTLGDPFYQNVGYYFSQVWGYPFLFKPATCSALAGATISMSPNSDTNELGTSSIQIHTVKAKVEANGAGVSGVEVNFKIISGPNAKPENVGSGATNSNGEAPFNYSAVQGQAGLGTDVIEACFTDVNDNKVCAQATKKWVDTTPPEAKCLKTTGDKKIGWYELTAKDLVDPNPKIFVVDTGSSDEFGPFTSGTMIQYKENSGKPTQKKNEKYIDIKGNGKPAIRTVDASGNEAKASCI